MKMLMIAQQYKPIKTNTSIPTFVGVFVCGIMGRLRYESISK